MSVSAILTQGFGSFGGVTLIPTLGFGSPTVPPVIVTPPEEPTRGGIDYHHPTSTRIRKRKESVAESIAKAERQILGIKDEIAEAEKSPETYADGLAQYNRDLKLAQYKLQRLQQIKRKLEIMEDDAEVMFLLMHSPLF